MPIYDYACGNCGERVEVLHGVHAPGPERCERCGKGPMRKLLTAPTIHFKGTGWAKKERTASRAKANGSDGSRDSEKVAEASERSGADSGGDSTGEKVAADKPTADKPAGDKAARDKVSGGKPATAGSSRATGSSSSRPSSEA